MTEEEAKGAECSICGEDTLVNLDYIGPPLLRACKRCDHTDAWPRVQANQ